MIVCGNPSRFAFYEILRPVRLTQTTMPHSSSEAHFELHLDHVYMPKRIQRQN